MDTFKYTPLDKSQDCIRLLRFMNRPPSSELENFALDTYDVATAPAFVALSYTWGTPEPRHDIIVNGSLLPIRENLYMALKALRSFFLNQASFLDRPKRLAYRNAPPPRDLLQENGYPLMWVDAVCINQSDHLEKNHQVNLMAGIFSKAESVISWLGEEADHSGCLMKAIQETTLTRQYGFEVEEALNAFVKRPYWRRMWVIQEFVLPQDLLILCGHKGVWWEDLDHFWHDQKLVCGADGGYRYFKGGSVQSAGEGGLATLIHARWTRCRRGYFLDYDFIGPASVDYILTRFRYGECHDPRDRIYALLSLIEPPAGFEPLLADYQISAEDLYYRVLGYVGRLSESDDRRRFRKELREALDSSSWAGAEAAELHEIVYKVVEVEHSRGISSRFTLFGKKRRLSRKVQECLAEHLGQPVDSDWTYQAMIRRFEAFPRGEDPRTWQRFDNLLQRALDK